ncbi:hypothetical protein EVAR_56120_1 [Eumeta japonica]|uniref:Uncharacterized protein n=1 Tax=Eumeta variegata TaxID=151549 RepID=A0A4C1YC57_EUMVA|nr:hypothetical protein EVAR_56120_1 [Eumeta japonica]
MYNYTFYFQIWIVATVPLILCQDERTEDLLHIYTTPESPNESITSYTDFHRESSQNGHSINSLNEYPKNDNDKEEKNEGEHRSNIARSDYKRKIFHIKNPFQHQLDQNEGSNTDEFSIYDNDTGASDQYAAMQYSLPPEEFLQRMRAERYFQQMTTPIPAEYTATPQPQHQYSSKSQIQYNPNQMSRVEQKDLNVVNNQSPSQYDSPVSYSYNTQQSTPSSISNYISTVLPDLQYIGTSANSQPYASSAATTYFSSPFNPQQYDSYPVSTFQSFDYNNHLTTPANTLTYNNDESNSLHIRQYDNSANGARNPFNTQYQNEIAVTTFATPVSSLYTDTARNIWQNTIGANYLSKSLHDVNAISQYQNQIQNGLQESQSVSNDILDTRTMNNLASTNNVDIKFAQPDYSTSYDATSRPRDLEHATAQPELYSHGDYGWKLSEKNPSIDSNTYSAISYGHSNPQTLTFHSNNPINAANFQNNLHNNNFQSSYYSQSTGLDHSHNFKALRNTLEGKEFAKAALKAHENMKQQETKINKPYNYNLASNHGTNNVQHKTNAQTNVVSTLYGNNYKQSKYTIDTPKNEQNDVVTASPFYYSDRREVLDSKGQQPFDHMKALKNIVPIDESNVLENLGIKMSSNSNNNQYNIQNYQTELALSDQFLNIPLADAYYKNKHSEYGSNIRQKLDDTYSSERIRSDHPNIILYRQEHENQNHGFDNGLRSDQRTSEILPRNNYLSQMINSYQENLQQPANVNHPLQKGQIQTLNGVLRLNDVPYKLTQDLTANAFKLHNSNFDNGFIPQPIPSRINQNVDSHQLDVTKSILNKILSNNRQVSLPANQNNNIDLQTGSSVSAINGFKVANPFNVDLRLVADMLKGKPAVDETRMALLREQFSKPLPLKLDMSTLQQLLLKDDSYNPLKSYVVPSLANGATILRNPSLDIYGHGLNPHQNMIKYSRSQEEEESIVPLAESTNTHPLGVLIEQDDMPSREIPGVKDLTRQDENGDQERDTNFENRSKLTISPNRHNKDYRTHRHPNSLISHPNHQIKFSQSNIEEPYPLLKPPPPVNRGTSARFARNKNERRGRRRRLSNKMYRTKKVKPVLGSDTSVEVDSESPPILLKPPPGDNFEGNK